MESGKCIFCGGEFENKEGCKPKKYCSELCKVKQFQKDNPKGSLYVRVLKSEYDDLVRRAELGDLKTGNENKVETHAETKKAPQIEQKAVKTINGLVIREKVSAPAGLTDFQLREWKSKMKKQGFAV